MTGYSELHGAVLEMFYFERLVIDEFHEACRVTPKLAGAAGSERERKLMHSALCELRARNVWGLTATPPIADAASVRAAAELLHVGPLHRSYEYAAQGTKLTVNHAAELDEARHFMDHFARQNTWDESAIVVEHHFVPVRFTRAERVLYMDEENRSGLGERLLRLCTHFEPDQLEGASSAGGTVQATQQRHRQELEELRQKNAATEAELESIRGQKRRLTSAEEQHKTHLNRSLGQLRSWLRDKEACLAYFEKILQKFQVSTEVREQEEELECSICLDEISRDTLALLPCGHFFHKQCVSSVLRELAAFCPECRTPLKNKEKDIVEPGADLALAEEQEARRRNARFGTKIAKVVAQATAIRTAEPAAKCVVFVQWETLLRKVHRALADSGLPCLELKGNIFQRQQTLRRFEESAAREHAFLLLSLESSTSGMNLTVANHLFLVHPCFVGSQSTAVAYEQQAIGRVVRQGQAKTVHIYRFVAEDTIEQQLTEKHQDKLYKEFQQREATRKPSASSASASGASVPPGTSSSPPELPLSV